MNFPSKSLFSVFLLVVCLSCFSQDNLKIGFYNVENLFDTINDPLTADDEFTPTGKKAYNSSRYLDKLTKLARAINNSKLYDADMLGLCEVENKDVLKDLMMHELLSGNGYKAIHYNSPDGRGIDCALIYKASTIKILEHDSNEFQMHFAARPNTRNQLHVLAYHKKRKQKIHVFINHWPSRYGGEKKTQQKRVLAAQELKRFVEDKTATNNYPVVIIGDLNDEPNSESILNAFGADTSKITSNRKYFNTSFPWQKLGNGTYKQKGQWNVLDHIIITKKMANNLDVFKNYYAEIIDNNFLLYTGKNGDIRPNRSYGGTKYFGGYSDHLPVMITLQYK
jgi:predicted extracellular nuclease